jgi:hypothetical protein
MKTNKYIIFLIAILAFTVACDNDGGKSAIDTIDVAVPNMSKSEGSVAFLDLIKIGNGEVVTINFRAELAQGKPTKTDVALVLVTAAGPVYHTILEENAQLPKDYTLTSDDIAAAFTALNNANDLALGDVLSISTRYTFADGFVVDIIDEDGSSGTGTNIQNNVLFTSVINYPVSCPSDIGGTYLVTSTGVGCCGVAPITNHLYTVTVTDDGGGAYSLSDFSGGAYDGLFCGPFGICGDASGGVVTDVCSVLSGSNSDCCGDTIEFSGNVNADGTWTVSIESGFVSVVSTWTKQ